MPTSDPEGRDWAIDRLKDITTPIVYDVGPGEGTYSDLAKGWTDALWVGVEIWEPYIQEFDLDRKYDIVLNKDLLCTKLPRTPYTLIACDVLEHLPRFNAVNFLNQAKEHAQHIMVSVPVVDYPQHVHDGNPFEEHLDQWSFSEMWDVLKPGGTLHAWRGQTLGRFWWTRSS